MKRNTLSTVLGLAALILAGLAQPAAAAEERPFQAEGMFTFAGVEKQFLIYDGIGSHVGDFSAVVAVNIKGNSGMAEGFITITSANGDSLDIVFEQTFDGQTGCFIGPYTIVGGTGRFENAGGSGDLFACVLGPGSVGMLIDGTISD